MLVMTWTVHSFSCIFVHVTSSLSYYHNMANHYLKYQGSRTVLLLENLRFCNEEELNSKSFAKELAKNGDIFINEAFSCSHRAHASICEITNHIDSYSGKMLLEEINFIRMLTSNAKKPVACIMGGSKISTKIGILSNLLKKMETIVIVGAMANNFIRFNGQNIGKSFFEKNADNIAVSYTHLRAHET